jgi:hypothetical protein
VPPSGWDAYYNALSKGARRQLDVDVGWHGYTVAHAAQAMEYEIIRQARSAEHASAQAGNHNRA